MKKMIVISMILCLAAALPLAAEVSMTNEISLLGNVEINDDPESWSTLSLAESVLNVASTGNSNVKAEVSLKLTTIAGMPITASVPDAWIKARFPSFRITVGKTRLSWGDGFFFNAADLLFGSTDAENIDLISQELRTETAILASAQIPTGLFSFGEVVLRPSEDKKLYNTAAGGRYYTMIGSTKAEFAYLYHAPDGHRASISLQGNIGPDWYAAVESGIDEQFSDIQDNLDISFGLFHLEQINRIASLSLRLEGLVKPFAQWNEGMLFFYPDISYSPSQEMTVSLRSVILPHEPKADITAGMRWNMLQGFTLLGYASTTLDDHLSSVNLSVGINYIY
jgi:hypothetical protein